jgi:ribosome-binding protein aMBF1 (putative translation factor)
MSRPHPIPDAALDADIAILGKKGRGKTFTAKGLVERLLDMGRRVLVLDPLSVWWGLKASADGRSPGYPIPVFGGPKADIAITGESGHVLGQLLTDTHTSAVLDMGLMRKAEQARLVADVLEHLFTVNREPLWLVLEEADAFAPQQPMGDMTRVLGEVDRIARRGRNFGFRLISITQRPAKLNKDVLTQLSTLIALGVTSPQDRDAIKAWVDGNADRDKARDVYDSLAQLKVGEGWIWAPDHDLLKRVKFPHIKTLDTSKTPKAGDTRITAPVLAGTDIAKIKAAFARIASGRANTAVAAKRAQAKLAARSPAKTTGRQRAAKGKRAIATAPTGILRDPVAAAIMHARTAANLTQAQLAARLNTDQGNVARLERGRSIATLRTLQRIAAATGHTLSVEFVPIAKK